MEKNNIGGPGAVSVQRLLGMRRGLEKESLRVRADGMLADTSHPAALGSALTHPHITTDFCESQVELITGAHKNVQTTLDELVRIQTFTQMHLGPEMLWASSMPCGLPADDDIPLGQYGTSNVGRSKTIYRRGLGYRYGRRMQTISGIHYNWSLPEVSSESYFALIRNFRRHAFLLLYLFGASPAVCGSFVEGRKHALQPLGERSMYLPHATSLRMGRLGYQSDAQASLAVSYNGLEGYAASLQEAMTRPYPPYETIGLRDEAGDYRQLATSLLQIENEFYGTIRPKRVIHTGERPVHALRERGVEYVEVRLMDLDPFEPVGISASTMRFLDIFLLHCLTAPSAPDTPAEIAALGRNQQRVAERGREPGLLLERGGSEVELSTWGMELLQAMKPLAAQLDAAHGSEAHRQAWQLAEQGVLQPQTLPSARVLRAIQEEHAGSFVGFVRAQSEKIRSSMLSQPLAPQALEELVRQSTDSLAEQRAMEAADSVPFDVFLQQYLAPERLQVRPLAA